jgi:hypothetical protein
MSMLRIRCFYFQIAGTIVRRLIVRVKPKDQYLGVNIDKIFSRVKYFGSWSKIIVCRLPNDA